MLQSQALHCSLHYRLLIQYVDILRWNSNFVYYSPLTKHRSLFRNWLLCYSSKRLITLGREKMPLCDRLTSNLAFSWTWVCLRKCGPQCTKCPETVILNLIYTCKDVSTSGNKTLLFWNSNPIPHSPWKAPYGATSEKTISDNYNTTLFSEALHLLFVSVIGQDGAIPEHCFIDCGLFLNAHSTIIKK